MFAKPKLLAQFVKNAFKIEALESRILLSGDPVFGAMQVASTRLLEPNAPLDAFSEQYTLANFQKLNQVTSQQASIYDQPEADANFQVDDTPFNTANITTDLSVSVGDSTIGQDEQSVSAVLAATMDAGGEDISFIANSLAINEAVHSSGSGATLTIQPIESDMGILLGDSTKTDSDLELHLDNSELELIQSGFSAIVIGSDTGSHTISIGDDVKKTVVVNDNLILKNPAFGGHIYINQDLVAKNNGSIQIFGSGNTTDWAGNVAAEGNVEIYDSIHVNGDVSVISGAAYLTVADEIGFVAGQTIYQGTNLANATATAVVHIVSDKDIFIKDITGSFVQNSDVKVDSSAVSSNANTVDVNNSGDIILGTANSMHYLDGLDGSGDTLNLNVNGGDVTINSQIGKTNALNGIQVENAINVTFEMPVNVTGDIVINATGSVIFNSDVEINGNLTINGATSVIFKGANNVIFNGNVSLTGGGDITIEADEIDFNGSVTGSGLLTLRTATVGNNIELGSPTTSVTDNTLNITNAEIAQFSDGFTKIIIGHQDVDGHAKENAGNIRIGAINASQQPTLRDTLEVYGGNITVEDYSNKEYTLQVLGDITLDAANNITITNTIEASNANNTALSNITLYSESGLITQASNASDTESQELIITDNLTVTAEGGASLWWTAINTLDAVNTGDGDIRVHTQAFNSSIDAKDVTSDLAIKRLHQTSTTGTGGMVISTDNGNITVLDSASAGSGIVSAGIGNIMLTSQLAAIIQNANVLSNGGVITFAADTEISMANGVTTNANTGSVAYTAGQNIVLSTVNAQTAITLTAGNTAGAGVGQVGSIQAVSGFSGTFNLSGETTTVTLAADNGMGESGIALKTQIGGLTATNTNNGGLFITESTDLSVLSSGITMSGTGGDVVLTMTDGGLIANGEMSANNDILLSASETNEATDANITLNASMTSATGNISVIAKDGIVQNNATADINAQATGMTIELLADAGISMVDGALTSTNNGNVRYQALGGDITIAEITAGTGTVGLFASGSILDLATDTSTVDISAANLMVSAGQAIGESDNHLDTTVGMLSSVSTAGSTFITESDAVTIDTLTLSINRVATTGASSATATETQQDLSSGADLVLVATAGSITTTATTGAVTAAGNLLLSAGGSTSNLNLNANVTSSAGHISLNAGQDVVQNANVTISATAEDKTIDVLAARNITMADGTQTTTTNGDARLEATSGNITTETINLVTGSLNLMAGTDIVDIDGDSRITANGLMMTAGSGIGSSANVFNTAVGTLAASAVADGIFVTETSGLIIGNVTTTVNRIASDATTSSATTSGTKEDLITSANGALVITVTSGDLIINGGTSSADKAITATGSGNVRLQAVAGNLALNSGLNAGTGYISIVATGGTLTQTAKGDISTKDLGTETRTIDVSANVIDMQDGAVTSAEGNIRYVATTALALGQLITTGDISLSAGSITDANSVTNNLTADELRIVTTGTAVGNGAGTSDNHLEIEVTQLSADIKGTGTGGLYITEADALKIGTLSPISVSQVGTDGTSLTLITTDPATAPADSNLHSDGNLVLVATAGGIDTLDTGVITAVGNVLLQSGGATSDLTLNANVTSSAGHISLNAGQDMVQKANITISTSTAGNTIDVLAGRNITMNADSSITTLGGDVRLDAVNNINLSLINAGAGDVALNSSAGQVLDNQAPATSTNVVAKGLFINAQNGVGAVSNAIETTVTTWALHSANGSVFVSDTTSVVTGTVTVDVNTINSSGVASNATSTLTGVTTAAGNIVLNAKTDLGISADISSTNGAISLDAESGALTMAGTAKVTATNSSARLNAATDLTVGNVVAQNVSLVADTGSIINAAGSTINVIATNLRLNANNAIGTSTRHLTTTVATISTVSGTGTFITETDSITVGQR